MKRFVPNYILEKVNNQEFSGILEAYVINLDIVGFTKTADMLIEKGKDGIEILSELINGVFSPIIEKIHAVNGFIASFAGDSMTILIRYSALSHVEEFVLFTSSLLKTIETNANSGNYSQQFQFKAKAGLSIGNVNWEILKGTVYMPFFYGEAIEIASLAQKNALENNLAISDFIFHKLKNHALQSAFLQKENQIYIQIHGFDASFQFPNSLETKSPDRMIHQKHFVYKQLLEQATVGEFRTVVSCFINFLNVDFLLRHFLELNEFIVQNGGYLNKIIHDDKGYQMLVLFGAPVTTEEIANRSANFVLQVKNFGGKNVRVGFSMGTVFAGFVGNKERCEYTALGTEVNKSARLMMIADWGDALTDSHIPSRLKQSYIFEKSKPVVLKGFSQKMDVFILRNFSNIDKKEDTVFIGRNDELDCIKERIAKCCSGHFGGIVFLEGEAGIGKSYLLQKIEDENQTDLYWTSIICDEILHSSLFPLKIYMNNFFQLPESIEENQIIEQVKIRFQNIRKQITNPEMKMLWNFSEPYLLELLEIDNPELQAIETKIKFENTLYALKNFFIVLSSFKPVVIVVDDGQWIDEDTAKFLEILIRNAGNQPLIILFACRSTERIGSFSEELEARQTIQLKLNHFSKEQILEYLQEHLQTNSIPTESLEIFSQKTEGNPFFVDQFLMYLRENALLSANFEILPSKLTIPDSISSIIIARIDKLTQLLKQVVQTASILGREFAADVLSKMLTDIPVKNYLKEGEKESIWNAVTELKYLFKHSLLRETVYEMQLKKRIRELHQLAAETYLNLYAKNVQEHYPEICFHFEKAGNREKTKQYLKEAADYSINHSHIFDAVHFMERLYSILFNEFNIDDFLISNEMEIEQDFSPYVQLALRLAEYYWYCGFAQKSADLFEQTLEFIKKWGDKKALLKGLIAQNKLFVDIGEYHKGLENIKLADEIFESFQDKGLWIEINNSAGQIYNEFGDYSKAIQHYEAALNASAEQRDEDLLSVIYTNLGVSYSYLGKYDKAIDLLEKALAIEEKVNRTISKVKVLGDIASIYYEKNDFAKAIEIFSHTYKISNDIGYKQGLSIASGNLGIIYRQQGKNAQALEFFQKKMDISKEIGDKRGLSFVNISLGNLHLDRNELDLAMEYYQKAMRLAETMGDTNAKAIILGNMGEIFYQQGKIDKALEYLDIAIQIETEIHFLSHLVYLLTVKTKILLNEKRYAEAKEVNQECFELINPSDFPQFFLKAEIAKQIIHFHLSDKKSDKRTAFNHLKNMLRVNDEPAFKALIAYEIALMMRDLNEISPEHIENTITLIQGLELENHEDGKLMLQKLLEMKREFSE